MNEMGWLWICRKNIRRRANRQTSSSRLTLFFFFLLPLLWQRHRVRTGSLYLPFAATSTTITTTITTTTSTPTTTTNNRKQWTMNNEMSAIFHSRVNGSFDPISRSPEEKTDGRTSGALRGGLSAYLSVQHKGRAISSRECTILPRKRAFSNSKKELAKERTGKGERENRDSKTTTRNERASGNKI